MSAPSVATACPDCLTSRSTLPQSTAGSRRTAAHTQAVGKTSARPAQLSHTSACTPGSIPSTALIRTAERASPNPATSRRTWPATAKSGPTSARIWTAGKASNYPAASSRTWPATAAKSHTHVRYPDCGKSFKLPCNLKSHLASHSEERPHVCPASRLRAKLQTTRHPQDTPPRAHWGEATRLLTLRRALPPDIAPQEARRCHAHGARAAAAEEA